MPIEFRFLTILIILAVVLIVQPAVSPRRTAPVRVSSVGRTVPMPYLACPIFLQNSSKPSVGPLCCWEWAMRFVRHVPACPHLSLVCQYLQKGNAGWICGHEALFQHAAVSCFPSSWACLVMMLQCGTYLSRYALISCASGFMLETRLFCLSQCSCRMTSSGLHLRPCC